MPHGFAAHNTHPVIGSLFIAVFIYISVSAPSKDMQNKKFEKLLSKVSNNIQVDVIRNRRRQQILLSNVVFGDVICLKNRDQVPADGIFLDGHSLQMDESDHNVEVNSSQNPFLFSGTKVVDGYARMLATAVGISTTWGQIMSKTSYNTSERTLLKTRVRKLTSWVDLVGLVIAFSGLLIILCRYFTGHSKKQGRIHSIYNGSYKVGRGRYCGCEFNYPRRFAAGCHSYYCLFDEEIDG